MNRITNKLFVSCLKSCGSDQNSKKLLLNGPNLRTIWLSQHRNNSNQMKVTVLGAGGKLGKCTSLMLKQSPHIDELCLYCHKDIEGFARDLNYIDTKCKVTFHSGISELPKALSKSHVLVVLAAPEHSGSHSFDNLFERNSPVVKELAVYIAKHSPKSVIAIGTEPINSMVPMFSEIMKKHGYYNPNAIFGITTIDVVRANKFVADVLGLDPECVTVPVIGGHSEKTIVPVLSKAAPCNDLTNEELESITNSVRQASRMLLKTRSDGPYLGNSFATARFVISLVKAWKGQPNIVECAFVKSKVHGNLRYMVTPLLLGPGGLVKNMGIPDLTDYEACLLNNAAPLLTEDIKKGEFVGGKPMDIVDGKLVEKPICDPCDSNPKAPRCPPDHCEIQALFEKK